MKTEKVVAVILLIGLTLKSFHIPGGNLLTIMSMLTLCLLYFPMGVYFLSDAKVDQKTVWFSILSGFALSTTLVGVLFKIMYWPGAFVSLLSGLITLIPVSLISYANYTNPKRAEEVTYYKNIFRRAMIAVILGLLSFVF